MRVSIVIPAYNAGATIREALDSVLAQGSDAWEAIVVDDGSTDDTASIAAEYASRDHRIRLISQPNAGEGAARNAGLAATTAEWVLFLDSDDWIAPQMVERALGAATEGTDGMLTDWRRVIDDGAELPREWRVPPTRMFEVTARHCPFPVHSCVIRTSLVRDVGGFEPYPVGADWDLWQRVARAGARLTSVDDVLAYYRVRPGSAVSRTHDLLRYGLRIIDQGHAADPRVRSPAAAFAGGAPAFGRAHARLSFVSWAAGMLLARGEIPSSVLAHVQDDRAPDLGALDAAHSLFRAALLSRAEAPSAWYARWSEWEPPVREYLEALEARSGARQFAMRAMRRLAWIAVRHANAPRPLRVGGWRHEHVEVTEPLRDIDADGAERVQVTVFAGGELLGEFGAAAVGGILPRSVLADLIAARFAWELLGRFFAHSVYPQLAVEEHGSVLRMGVQVGGPLAPTERDPRSAPFHDRIGWTAFLQELLGAPDRPASWFYHAAAEGPEGAVLPAGSEPRIAVEIGHALPSIRTARNQVEVSLHFGGLPVMLLHAAPLEGRLTTSALRALICGGGFDLCIAAVREGVIGRRFADGTTLRERLAERARERSRPTPVEGMRDQVIARESIGASDTVIGRRDTARVGTSGARRARLPRENAPSFSELAWVANEPVYVFGDRGGASGYVPELFGPDGMRDASARTSARGAGASAGEQREFDRHHFETVFLASRDPWRYASAFERRKYEHTLQLLPAGRAQRAHELACAEGMFTELLAPRVERLVATDISRTAIERAAVRCAAHANITFDVLDFVQDPIDGPYDLIVCSEALYYLRDEDTLRALAQRIADALAPGGAFITAHSNVLVDDASSHGLDWDVPFGARRMGEIIGATPALEFACELRTRYYRVQRFERTRALRRLWGRSHPAPAQVIEAEHVEPEPEVAARFKAGGAVTRGHRPQAKTWRLPILSYHQVSDEGSPSFARYRMTPAQFEEQMRYLHSAGFRTVTLEEWLAARQRWQPLEGRCVLLTFDDGTRDFGEHALPVLERYRFGSMVFVVTRRVGTTNVWDAAFGENTPLLDWDELRALSRRGVGIGSHTATHPYLTALPLAELTAELIESRTTLERELGVKTNVIAYPHSDEDEVVQHIAGAVGYEFGLSCRNAPSPMHDPLLSLNRIEVRSGTSITEFIALLETE